MSTGGSSRRTRCRPTIGAVVATLACVQLTHAQPGTRAPKVVRTIPAHGATDVEPGTSEIVVEFDRDMQKGYSWCGGGPSYPKTTERPSWRTPRICVLPVRLEPNREYSLSINCPAAQNFRSKAGTPVEPYPLSFRTGSGRSGVDLLQRYPTTLTAADADPKRARAWRFAKGDLFELSRFSLEVGSVLRVRTGKADVGVGHCADGAVWAVVIPRTSGRLNSPAAEDSEKVTHIWLRMHPREINALFPRETVRGAGNQDLFSVMRRIASHKIRASWQAGGRALIPAPNRLTVDVDTDDSRRRFFDVDRDAGIADYVPAFEQRPVPKSP